MENETRSVPSGSYPAPRGAVGSSIGTPHRKASEGVVKMDHVGDMLIAKVPSAGRASHEQGAPISSVLQAWLAWAVLLAALAITPGRSFGQPPRADEIARAWAPVVYQDVRQDGSHGGRFDLITNFDFDGDYDGTNNWNNAGDYEYDLLPYVYYNVIETETRYFITYSLFHPRDWTWTLEASSRDLEHENDLEGVTLVVEKVFWPNDQGRLIAAFCIFHFETVAFANDLNLVPAPEYTWDLGGPNEQSILAIDDATGRPCIFVEDGGHGIGGISAAMTPGDGFLISGTEYAFRGSDQDGIRFVPMVGGGGPSLCDPHNLPSTCEYQLLPLETTLWAQHLLGDPENTYQDLFTFELPSGCTLGPLPEKFSYSLLDGGAANPPWAWDNTSLGRGWWFLEPASTMWELFPNYEGPTSDYYLYHPFWAYQDEVAFRDMPSQWIAGTDATISFDYMDVSPAWSEDFQVFLSTDGGRSWSTEPICLGTLQGSNGTETCQWTIEGSPEPLNYLNVRVRQGCTNKYVAGFFGPFAVELGSDSPTVRLLAPNGGESWPLGSQQEIAWEVTSTQPITDVLVRLSLDGGVTYPHLIGAFAGDPGAFTWAVPGLPEYATDQAMVEVTVIDDLFRYAEDASDGPFSIRTGEPDGVTVYATPHTVDLYQPSTLYVTVRSNGVPVPNEEVTFTTVPQYPGSWSGGDCGAQCITTDQYGEGEITLTPTVTGSIVATATVASGAFDEAVIYVNEPDFTINLTVQTLVYGNPSRYRFTAHVEDANGPVVGENVTLTTDHGYFSESGGPEFRTDTGSQGNASGDVVTSDFGDILRLCCRLDRDPQNMFACTDFRVPIYPPPPIAAPFDTLSLIVNSPNEYDDTGGLEWSPAGDRIAGGGQSQVQIFSYPDKQLVANTPIADGQPTMDLSYDAGGTRIAVSNDRWLYVLDANNGQILTQCAPSGNDPIYTVDPMNSSTILFGRQEGSGCRLGKMNPSNCSQSYCYPGFPPSDSYLNRARWNGSQVVAVSSESSAGSGALAIFNSTGNPVLFCPDLVPNEAFYSDVDWLPDGTHVVAGGENFAAIFSTGSCSYVPLPISTNAYTPAVAGLSSDRVAITDLRTVRIFDIEGNPQGVWEAGPILLDLAWNEATDVLAAAATNGTFLLNLSQDHAEPILAAPTVVEIQAGATEATIQGSCSDFTPHDLHLWGRAGSGPTEEIPINPDETFEYTLSISSDTTEVFLIAEDYYRQKASTTVLVVREAGPDVTPPVVGNGAVNPPDGMPGTVFTITAEIVDTESGVNDSSAEARIQRPDNVLLVAVPMFDDGVNGGDLTAGDGVFTCAWNSSGATADTYFVDVFVRDNDGNPTTANNMVTFEVLPGDPLGACCFGGPPYDCIQLTEADCSQQGGQYLGDGLPCDSDTCWPALDGACCFSDESCLELTYHECWDQGGTFVDGSCTPNPCVFATGACCLPNDTCIVVTASECANQSGTYLGDDSSCVPNPCEAVGWWPGFGSPPGMGTNGIVTRFTELGDELIACGHFTDAGGTAVHRVAAWDGAAWRALGSPGDQEVRAVTVWNGMLVAGGAFPGNASAWDEGTQTWQTLGAGNIGFVYGFTEFQGKLIAVTNAGEFVYQWDGTTWEPVAGGVNLNVYSVGVHDGWLVIGGAFTASADQQTSLSHLARWDGSGATSFEPFGQPNGTVNGFGTFEGDFLIAGDFSQIGGNDVGFVAAWDGSTWSSFGGISSTQVANRFVEYCGDLYAAGDFAEIGTPPVSASRIAKWDGSSWSPLGLGINGSVWTAFRWDEALYLGGDFTAAGGDPALHIARWDGLGPCAAPTGACCLSDGSCVVLTQAVCDIQQGTYWGDDTVCDPNPCPQEMIGACCFGDGSCDDLLESECLTGGGTYRGQGTSCLDTPDQIPDVSGNGYSISFAGGTPEYVEDCLDSGIRIDDTIGTSTLGTVAPDEGLLLQAFTIEGTFRWFGLPPGNSNYQVIVDKFSQSTDRGRSWSLQIDRPTRQLFVRVFYDASNHYVEVRDPDPLSEPMAQCAHVALTVEANGEVRLYRDGVLKGSAPFDHTVNYQMNTPLGFANAGNNGSAYWGVLDDFRLSDVARTSFDVDSPHVVDANTVALWRFDGPCPQPPIGACCLPDESCAEMTESACASDGGTYEGDGQPCDLDPSLVPDSSDHGQDIVFSGSEEPGFRETCVGSALYVDGNVSWGRVAPTDLQMLQEFTIEGIIRWDGNQEGGSAGRVIVEKFDGLDPGRSWSLAIEKETRQLVGHVYYDASNARVSVLDPDPLPDPMTGCVHVALAVDAGNEIRLYRDGVQKATQPFPDSVNYESNSPIEFANAGAAGGTAPYRGIYDEFRLSSIARTEFEIANPVTIDEFTVAAWRFDSSVCPGPSDVPAAPSGTTTLLSRPVPNPTSNDVEFAVAVGDLSRTSVGIFDTAGRLVETVYDGWLQPGGHRFKWIGDGHPAGVYYVRVKCGGAEAMRTVVLLR